MTKLNPSIVFMENGQGATMNMNGLTEKYVVILENGKRLAGDDTYSRIDMSNVKRVEILNGAASACMVATRSPALSISSRMIPAIR